MKPMARALQIVAVALLAASIERPALACENAVQLSADERIKTLQEAEAALDEGEVAYARDLAWKVTRHGRLVDLGESFAKDRIASRAERVVALSYVRERYISAEQYDYALQTLQERRRSAATPDPVLDVDYAEALARMPDRHDDAYAILAPLARKDLVGSPNALGVLHRVAKERGDETTAADAKARCEGMIGKSPVCRGEYPQPPLVRGTTRSYLPHLLLALGLLAYRLVRSRRVAPGGTLPDGRSRRAPWIGHAKVFQALALSAGALYVFARATSPTWTLLVFTLVLGLTLSIERRGFFAAVRRKRIAGLGLRPSSLPDDAHLPPLALYGGPANAETLELEHADPPGYREPARTPLLRLERRRLPLALSLATVLLLVTIALLLLFMLFGVLLVRM